MLEPEGACATAPLAAGDPGVEAPADPELDPRAVLAVLEPDQLVAAKRVRFGPRRLSRALRGLLWGLRLYVVFMLVVVALQIARGLRGG